MVWRTRVIALTRFADLVVERACKGLLLVSGFGLLALLTIVVILRYVFESGLNSAPELSELMFAIFVMAGIALAAQRGAHVATQILIVALHGGWRKALAILINAITFVVYGTLGWYAAENAIIAHDQTTPVLGIPWSVGYGCLSAGLMLVALCSFLHIPQIIATGDEPKIDLAEPGAAST